MDFIRKLMVPPDKKIKLAKYDPADTLGHDDDHKSKARLDKTIKRLGDLQELFYAVRERALLIILQGMDASGKDGTIRHVMSGVSPQGCSVTSFKVPNGEELSHDFLWRIHKAVPEKGMIGIFNRSHYEDVLVVRVHKLVSQDVWKAWDDYVAAYEDVLSRCSTEYAPWFIIPSDHKWFRNLAISRIIVETLEEFDMHFPKSPQPF